MPWQTIDYVVRRIATPPSPANGSRMVLPVPGSPAQGQAWLLTGCTVICPTSIETACELFDQDPTQPNNVLTPCAGTQAGNFDFGDWGTPVIIMGGTGLWLVWQSVDVGVVCRARVQYELVQQSGASAKSPVAI